MKIKRIKMGGKGKRRYYFFLAFFLAFLVFCFFLGCHAWHMEIPRLGVESELEPPAYATDTATPELSRICNLQHSSQFQQRWILNPLRKARDWTRNLMVPSRICFLCATTGMPRYYFLFSLGHGFDLTSDFLYFLHSWNSGKTVWPDLKIGFFFPGALLIFTNLHRKIPQYCEYFYTICWYTILILEAFHIHIIFRKKDSAKFAEIFHVEVCF